MNALVRELRSIRAQEWHETPVRNHPKWEECLEMCQQIVNDVDDEFDSRSDAIKALAAACAKDLK